MKMPDEVANELHRNEAFDAWIVGNVGLLIC